MTWENDRSTDALNCAHGDEPSAARGKARDQRSDPEDRNADDEQRLDTDNVAELARRRRQNGKDEEISVDDPVRRDLREPEFGTDRRQGNPDHRLVEQDDAENPSHGGEDQPLALVCAGVGHRIIGRGVSLRLNRSTPLDHMRANGPYATAHQEPLWIRRRPQDAAVQVCDALRHT